MKKRILERLGMRIVLVFCLCSLATVNLRAQQPVMVKGTVVDSNGEPLIGATVNLKGNSSRGTITDTNGQFALSVPNLQSTLTIQFVGFIAQDVDLKGRKEIGVTLREDVKSLDDVVVVGYGTQKKKFLIGSVSQIDNKELTIAPQANLSNMMTGKLPGVTSVQRSGLPGDDQTSINIRGLGTFLDPSPLILVDGVERMLNTVNPNDVENISILKDAATAAVYGLAAANGVILITTKKGTEGKLTLSYDGSVTFQQNTAMPKMLNGPDYIYWYNKASELDGNGPFYGADIQSKVISGNDPTGMYGNTDWVGELFKNYGLTQQHNISASGGSKNIRFFASLGMLDQDGIIENVGYKRYNVRSNIDANITKDLTFQLNVSGFYEDKKYPGISTNAQAEQNPIQQAVYALPIVPLYYQGEYTATMGPGHSTTQSPIATIRNSGFQRYQRHEFDGNMKLTYSAPWIKGLKAALEMVYDFSEQDDNTFLLGYDVQAYSADSKNYTFMRASSTSEKGNYTKSASTTRKLMVRPSVEYQNTFGKHAISALFLYEQTQIWGSTMTGAKKGYEFDSPVDISLGTEWGDTPVTGSHSLKATLGYVGRLNYMFDKRYIAEFSFRVDGSYKFPKDKRWAFFPSVSLGWVLSEEKFIKENASFINLLKLRASGGELGSDKTDAFLYRSQFSISNNAYLFGGVPHSGLGASNAVTSSLTWARARSYDVGFELGLWDNRLGIEFDWFYKVTRDIQEDRGGDFPPSLGGNYAKKGNTGKVSNHGLELVISHRNRIKDFDYRLSGSVAWARNKVLARNEGEDTPWYRTAIGQPLGQLYGYKAIGLYQTQEDLDSRPYFGNQIQRLGDIMYEDVNGDGRITYADAVKIGHSTLPEINYSFNMNLNWKGFYLDALWQGAAIVNYTLLGNYNHNVVDNTVYTRPFYSGGNAPYYLVEDSWRPDHTNARYPRLSTIHNGNNGVISTWWMMNGNYLRLKNLRVGYAFPYRWLAKTGIGISALRVYVAATNLLTITPFKYVDPEMATINNGYYPQQKNYSVGMNITF
ncbi:MAG: TonB-dependent receptor [Mediterranea sp.]|jgi:TonB-linked SusC/RagA family outer membrane protein|nr:TonB-dependent receptor [Mediterranea sp.]